MAAAPFDGYPLIIQLKQGLFANLMLSTTYLMSGELAYTTDTNQLYISDSSSVYLIPIVQKAGLIVSLNTTSTPVASFTPTSTTGQQFRICWVLSCVTSSTPTLQVTFTDPKAGAQTITLYNSAMTNGNVAQGTYILLAKSTAPIAITGSDSLALGDIFATATIEQLQ